MLGLVCRTESSGVLTRQYRCGAPGWQGELPGLIAPWPPLQELFAKSGVIELAISVSPSVSPVGHLGGDGPAVICERRLSRIQYNTLGGQLFIHLVLL
jgi:hypothetical protein